MNSFVFFLCLLVPSCIGGYLATKKSDRGSEELGHHLAWISTIIGVLVICLPDVSSTPIEIFGLVVATVELLGVLVAVAGGFLLGVFLWRDTPVVANSEQQAEQPG